MSLALVSKQGFVGADDGRRRKTIGESRHFGRIIISLNIICVLHIMMWPSVCMCACMQAVPITPKFLMFQKTSDVVALNVLRFGTGRYLSYFSGVKVDLILPKKRQ